MWCGPLTNQNLVWRHTEVCGDACGGGGEKSGFYVCSPSGSGVMAVQSRSF